MEEGGARTCREFILVGLVFLLELPHIAAVLVEKDLCAQTHQPSYSFDSKEGGGGVKRDFLLNSPSRTLS